MTTQYVLDIALANDDPYPDDVCPGCGTHIEGWRLWMYHRPGGAKPRFMNGVMDVTIQESVDCPWDRDYLVARMFRRRWIAEGVTR